MDKDITPEGAITLYYFGFFFAVAAAMKFTNLLTTKDNRTERWSFVFLSPVLTMKAWRNRRELNRPQRISALIRLTILGVLLFVYFTELLPRVPAAIQEHALWPYWCLIPFGMFVEFAGAYTEIVLLPFKILLPPINNSPWLSRSLSEFWGKRWNRAFGNWFFASCFMPFHRKPNFASALSCFVSGIIHEITISVPFWLVYESSVFGMFMLYFFIQYSCIAIERRFMRNSRWARAFTWLTIVGPIPLVLNEGTLRAFHLIN